MVGFRVEREYHRWSDDGHVIQKINPAHVQGPQHSSVVHVHIHDVHHCPVVGCRFQHVSGCARIRGYERFYGAHARVELDGAQRERHATPVLGHGQVYRAVVSHRHPGGHHVAGQVLAFFRGPQPVTGLGPFQMRPADNIYQLVHRQPDRRDWPLQY